jgi:adenine phosphoribosyltransferase
MVRERPGTVGGCGRCRGGRSVGCPGARHPGLPPAGDHLQGPHPAPGRSPRLPGVEARGFILAAPIAYRFGAGFTPVRKAGKLPWQVEAEEYELEYGTDLLEIHKDAIEPGERILVIDDVLATGGTAAATVRLVERLGGEVVGLGFVLELAFLDGRSRLPGRDVVSLVTFG